MGDVAKQDELSLSGSVASVLLPGMAVLEKTTVARVTGFPRGILAVKTVNI